MRRVMLAGLAATLLVVAGCEAPVDSTKASATAPSTPAADVNVTVGGIEDFEALLAAQQGKVILVDFWSTSCGPCLENFPHTVKLSNQYRDEGLATIAVSMDDPDNLSAVKSFLGKQKDLDFDNLLSRDGMSQKSAVDFDFNGVLPHYRLYDRQGKLAHQWDGVPEDLEAKIKELLASS